MYKVHRNSAHKARGDTGRFAVSLSIAFYNSPKLWEMMLAALERQTFTDFEVIFCDDGSRPEVVEELKKSFEKTKIAVKHLWHEDRGFRKNRIMNWGIFESSSEYLIYVDQDCLPHPEFIKEHLQNRQAKTVLCGRRLNLTPWVSRMLTPSKIRDGFIEKNLWWIVPFGCYMKDNNGIKGIYLKSPFLRKYFNRKFRGIVGCNFSVFKQDMLDINGFDFRYEAAGTGEDTDIEFRLKLNQVKMKPFTHTAVQYHVWHKLLSRQSPNEDIFREVVRQGSITTEHGLKEQLKELTIK